MTHGASESRVDWEAEVASHWHTTLRKYVRAGDTPCRDKDGYWRARSLVTSAHELLSGLPFAFSNRWSGSSALVDGSGEDVDTESSTRIDFSREGLAVMTVDCNCFAGVTCTLVLCPTLEAFEAELARTVAEASECMQRNTGLDDVPF